jgi:hypothetical protein
MPGYGSCEALWVVAAKNSPLKAGGDIPGSLLDSRTRQIKGLIGSAISQSRFCIGGDCAGSAVRSLRARRLFLAARRRN